MNIHSVTTQIANAADGQSRHLVAIAGPPASGKSTLAEALNSELCGCGLRSKVVPMDGFHLDNSVLIQRDALSRKGAPHTFDAEGFINTIKHLAHHTEAVSIPVFDRELDKSIQEAQIVNMDDQILLIEGNYLLIDQEPWDQLKPLWDQTIFVTCPPEELENRLIARWKNLGHDLESSRSRAQANDLPNAMYVTEHSYAADITLT